MPIGGLVELMSAPRIQGWALDTASASAPVVDLCIEGHKVKRIKALRRRPGFEGLVNGGTVGFRFKLHSSLLAYVRRPDAVTIELNGETLPIVENKIRLLPIEQRKDPKDIAALMADRHIITKQGELRLSVRYDKNWQDTYFSFYQEAQYKFKEMFGYDLFVCFGSMLGYVRDSALILTDDDLDCSYISRHTDPAMVRQEFIEIHKALRDAGEYSKIAPMRRTFLKWRQRSGEGLIDVFPAFVWKEHFFMAPGVGVQNGKFIAERGVKQVSWYGYDMLIPDAAEDVLAAAYGPGWKVYDPLFQWIIPRYARRGLRRITLSRNEMLDLNSYKLDELRASLRGEPPD